MLTTYCFLTINKYKKWFRLKRPTFSKYETMFLIIARQRSCGKASFQRCWYLLYQIPSRGWVCLGVVTHPVDMESQEELTLLDMGPHEVAAHPPINKGNKGLRSATGQYQSYRVLSCFQIAVSILLRIFSTTTFNYSYNNNILQKN